MQLAPTTDRHAFPFLIKLACAPYIVCLGFAQQGITQIEQSIGSSFKTVIGLLASLLQCAKVTFYNVLFALFS